MKSKTQENIIIVDALKDSPFEVNLRKFNKLFHLLFLMSPIFLLPMEIIKKHPCFLLLFLHLNSFKCSLLLTLPTRNILNILVQKIEQQNLKRKSNNLHNLVSNSTLKINWQLQAQDLREINVTCSLLKHRNNSIQGHSVIESSLKKYHNIDKSSRELPNITACLKMSMHLMEKKLMV